MPSESTSFSHAVKHKRDIILQFCSNPDAVLNALHQEGWQVIPKSVDLSALDKHDKPLVDALKEIARDSNGWEKSIASGALEKVQ